MRRQTCTLVVGAQGSGKSAGVVHYLATDVLPNEPGCHIWTNLSLNVDALAEYVEKRTRWRRRPVKADEVRQRVHLLDREAMKVMSTDVTEGGMTPHDYFRDIKLRGGLMVLDEGHLYCGDQFSYEHVHAWAEWLAELRHDVGPNGGASLMLLSIGRGNFPQDIEYMAGALWSIAPVDELRDPFFKIPLKDWYEIEAAFFRGKMVPGCEVTIKTRDDRTWKKKYAYYVRLEDWIFNFYNSFSARMSDGEEGEKPEETEKPQQFRFQQMGKGELLWWFLCEYPQISTKSAFWCGVLLFAMNGGTVMKLLSSNFTSAMNRRKAIEKRETPHASLAVKPPETRPAVDPGSLPLWPASQTNELPKQTRLISLDGIVGKRFLSGGFWYGIGDKFQETTVSDVDCDRGIMRLQDGRAGAVRGAGVAAPPDLASLAVSSPQPAPQPSGEPGRGGRPASNGPAGNRPTNFAPSRRQFNPRVAYGQPQGDGSAQ